MTDKELNLYLSRILSGYYIISYNDTNYKIVYPSISTRYDAELYAYNIYEKNKFNEWINDDDIIYWLIDMGIWTIDGDTNLKNIEKKIENLKVELFQSLLNPPKIKKIRKELSSIKNLYNKKFALRHSLDHITASGYCELLKNQFILLHSIFDLNNKLVFDIENTDYYLLEDISMILSNYSISATQFRKIARSEQWRQYWSSNKHNVFGKSSVDMTDEQKTLVILTKMYDSAYESTDCPSDNVFEDDDMFDGWMICQRREIEKNKTKKNNDKILGDKKLSNAQEVFMVAQTPEEAKAIYDLNDHTERAIIKERFDAIKGKQLSELELPDVQRDLLKTTNEQIKQKFRK